MASILPQILDSLARQTLEALDLASAVAHPGESGRAREEAVRRFLAQLLPPDFGIDTGFVIDAKGGISRQIDIVVYRKSYFPVLEIGGVKFFMIESVAAVIESKATIGSAAVLNDAMDNIASVKSLDRTNNGHNYKLPMLQPVQRDVFLDQVWGAVVAGASLTHASCVEVIADWLRAHERHLWPNFYVDIRDYLVDYVIVEEGFVRARTTDTTVGQGLVAASGVDRDTGYSPPLAQLAVELLDFLRVTPVIDFSPSGYFYRTTIPFDGGATMLDG